MRSGRGRRGRPRRRIRLSCRRFARLRLLRRRLRLHLELLGNQLLVLGRPRRSGHLGLQIVVRLIAGLARTHQALHRRLKFVHLECAAAIGIEALCERGQLLICAVDAARPEPSNQLVDIHIPIPVGIPRFEQPAPKGPSQKLGEVSTIEVTRIERAQLQRAKKRLGGSGLMETAGRGWG